MREANEFQPIRVVSEPGDRTRYDYIVIRNVDDFMFAPFNNTFRYPQKINRWEMEDEQKIADKHNCNIHTVKECIRTIQTIIQ